MRTSDNHTDEYMKPTSFNCTVLGDAGVGKTTLLLSLSLNMFNAGSLPPCVEGLVASTVVDDKPFSLELHDTPGNEWDVVRRVLYPNKKERLAIRPLHPTPHVVLVCYSIVSPASLDSVREKWFSELDSRFKGIPWLLVGTKLDLGNRDKANANEVVDAQHGRAVAESLGARGYVESSSFTQKGVKEVLEGAVTLARQGIEQKMNSKESSCLVQ